MGGCAGKSRSNSNTKQKSQTKGDQSKEKPSSSSPKNSSSVSNVKAKKEPDENVADLGNHVIIEEQNRFIEALRPKNQDPMADVEAEIELAILVYGQPERDYAENPLFAPTFKSSEV